MNHPLEPYQPRIVGARREKVMEYVALEQFLERNPIERLGQKRAFLVPLIPLVKGAYRTLTREEGRALNEEDPPIIIYAEGKDTHALFSHSDFGIHRSLFEGFHPMKPQGRLAKPEDSERGLEGIIREIVARHQIGHLLRSQQTGELFDEYEGKDLILAIDGENILKRTRSGNVFVLEPHEHAKFGYAATIELDGLLKYQNDEEHIYIIEAKQGLLSINRNNLRSKLLPSVGQFFPGAKLHYVLYSHHHRTMRVSQDGEIVNKQDDDARPIGHKMTAKERQIAMTVLEAGATPYFLDFGFKREFLDEVTQHIIRTYHNLKHLNYQTHAEATYTRNRIEIRDQLGTPLITLKKKGKGEWHETK